MASTSEDPLDNADILTPLRAHYLKKSLIQLQFNHELDQLTEGPPNVSTLSHLGSPFSPLPKGVQLMDLPFLRYIFHQFVLTFPFMAAAPKDFYSQKLQPFVAAMLSRNLAQTSVLDGAETEKASQKKILSKLERNLSLFLGSATKLVEQEEVVRLTQADLDRLETLSKKRQARMTRAKDHFEVNVVGVRTVMDKGRMRSRAHEEFIIRTRRSRYPDVFVSRRYGDFKTLADELAKAHPEEAIKPPPPKDRTYVVAPPTSPAGSSHTPASPLSRQSTTSSFNGYDPKSLPGPSLNSPPSRLAREKNRLTLRSYIHSLLASPTIASSPVLRSFLLSGATTLTREELEDARRREEADKVREDGRKHFSKEIASRVDGLREAVKSVKGDIMRKDGLTHIFATIKVTPDIRMLPPSYQAVTEWARISLASTVFHHFVASDDASESFAGLKRIHGLMPYFMLKAALKISNPISMIRSVLDLFLAQPFGGKSLLQRMFTSSLTEEAKALEEEIEAVKEKVDDPVMCAKVRQFVYAPQEIQAMFKNDAAVEKMNIITVVLRSAEEPILSRSQMHRLARAHKAHTVYLKHKDTLEDSDDDEGPQDEDGWLLEDLKLLTLLYSKLRGREQLIELIFEGFTAELLKDMITIFYSPLAQVYRAANIADSLGDLQNFVNDLIRTVEQVEELNQGDPHATVQTFIDLVQRHEQSFYNFAHKVHSKGGGLFDSLMRWIELFLTVLREGLGQPISLEFLLPHTKKERAEIFSEVDKIAFYHYKLKVLYEDKLRRRFGRAKGVSDADAEDEATQALIDGVVGEISFGDLVTGDAVDLAAEDSDEQTSSDEEEEDSSEYETESGDESEGSVSDEDNTVDGARTPVKRTLSNSTTTTSTTREESQYGPQRRVRTLSHSRSAASTSQQRTAVRAGKQTSLRPSRSMNFPFSGLSVNKQRNRDIPPVPPTPPLYATSQNQLVAVASVKPLPPDPSSDVSSNEQPPATPAKDSPPRSFDQQRPSQPPKQGPNLSAFRKKRGKSIQSFTYPDLVHIPNIRPLFAELLKPLLLSPGAVKP